MAGWRGLRAAGAERGQIVVFGAMLLTLMVGMTGLAVDVGVARVQQQAAQQAADSAAMAGADDIPTYDSSVVTDATAQATANGFTSGINATTVTVNYPPVNSQSHNGDTSSVEVVITRKVPTFFLPVFGYRTVSVTGHAVATATPQPFGPCDLCLLSPSGTSLTNNGDSNVSISAGAMTVDSNSSQAVVLDGQASVTAQAINVVGGYELMGGATISPTPTTGANPVPDPLAAVPAPSVSNDIGSVSTGGSTTLEPGVYSSIDISSSGTITFSPGVYVITGGLTISGSPTLIGDGVTLYFTCAGYTATNTAPCDGTAGAGLTLSGSVTYDLTAPTSGPYQGMTIFYDRGNTATLTLNGDDSDTFSGTIYAKSATAILNGNPEVDQLNSLIVVNSAILNGSGQVSITYNSANNYPIPPKAGSAVLTE